MFQLTVTEDAIFTVTEALYVSAGFHYVLVHVTGTVDVHAHGSPSDDVSDLKWVSTDPVNWASELHGHEITHTTDVVVRRALAHWHMAAARERQP